MQTAAALVVAYYVGLLLLLPGVVIAVMAYLLRGTLGDFLKDLWKVLGVLVSVSNLFPPEWAWQWGFAVWLCLFISAVGFVLFLGSAGILARWRPYGAVILFIIALSCLFMIVRFEGFATTPSVILMTAVSAAASAFVMWKSFGS